MKVTGQAFFIIGVLSFCNIFAVFFLPKVLGISIYDGLLQRLLSGEFQSDLDLLMAKELAYLSAWVINISLLIFLFWVDYRFIFKPHINKNR